MSSPPPFLPGTSEPGASVRLVVFDFDGVFTDNTVWTDELGRESVRCWRSDGLGLKKLKELSVPVWVLSTEVNPVVAHRCQKLDLACLHGLERKDEALRDLTERMKIPLDVTVYVGNDINDRGCLRLAGIPVVVRDAHPDVLADARFRTTRRGGYGAVREVCDWISISMARASEERAG